MGERELKLEEIIEDAMTLLDFGPEALALFRYYGIETVDVIAE